MVHGNKLIPLKRGAVVCLLIFDPSIVEDKEISSETKLKFSNGVII